MSKITEYLHACAVQYRTKAQKAFVELALTEFEKVAQAGGMEVTLIPYDKAWFYLNYGAQLNEVFSDPHTDDEPDWFLIHASDFDIDDLRSAFESHGFRVCYDDNGWLEVDWINQD